MPCFFGAVPNVADAMAFEKKEQQNHVSGNP